MHTIQVFVKNAQTDEVKQFDVSEIIDSENGDPPVKVDIKYSEESDSIVKIELELGSKYLLGPFD